MEFNAIYEGDNLEVMSKFNSKSIDLTYAGQPFFTNKLSEFIWTRIEPKLETCHRLLKDTGLILFEKTMEN